MIGRTISHYAIEDRLGEGGMGTVYLARDTLLDRKVAIKIVSPEAAGNPALVGRLLREAKAASRLNHPNIVTVYEIARAGDVDFIAMECVDGQPLSQLIPPGGLPIAQALDYAGQIAAALAAAHGANVVHRDIKPANVMVAPSGRLKVLDFGLAKITAPKELGESTPTATFGPIGATAPGLVVGTVGYMSPEQIEGRPTDARSDVFSVGVLLFEMLTGRRPFGGDSAWKVMAATVGGSAPSVAALRPEVPPELVGVVTRCLATRPADRYASAAELAEDLTRVRGGPETTAPSERTRRPSPLLIAAIGFGLLAVALLAWTTMRESRLRWARGPAIAEIERLKAKDDLGAAYLVGRKALAIAPDDSQVRQAWANLTAEATITSEPSGADVAFRGYTAPDGSWVSLGKTPLPNARIALGLLRWRLTKPGYDTLEVGQGADLLEFRLAPASSSPPGMVLVPKGSFQLESTEQQVALPDYLLDRYEVTNRQFKAFVDAGGYRKREYWREPFVKDGRSLTWTEAMAELRDATGRPGPSTWELGSYPEGQDDFPVGGVSWYEAAAYAAFAEKQLPTAYHWYRASGAFSVFSEILTASNFSPRGPAKVGSAGGLGPYGTFDMAGNVKEWCWNAATGARRYLLGGGWGEAPYMFRDEDARPPFERRATFGFRCMLQREPLAPRLAEAINTFERDPASLKPVGDEVFRAYLHLYDYDPTPLDPRVESVDGANPAWREERLSVRAAYGNERLPLRLFLPKSAAPPYQAVVFFPAADATAMHSSQNLALPFADFLVRSGRALVYPIYQGTYERRVTGQRGPNVLRDVMIQRGKDVRRTVDYLETRPDIDRSRIAFHSLSLGAQLAPLFLAIEPRFRTGVLLSGGFETWDMPAEADPVNFAPRVRVPVLMVNGREDFDLPYATAQVPLFRMLGTPEADKRHVVLEGGHLPSRPQEAFRVILEWLDARLGPVN
jgi:formylglycine-generating enzyme required for sulfatase activity/dienelactone hydrolase